MRRRGDIVAIALIWLCVLVGAFLAAPATDDDAGVGQLAGVVGFALTGLYLYVRGLRHRGRLVRRPAQLIRTSAHPGSTTKSWLKVVLVMLLWLAGSVTALLAGMHDSLALLLGGLLPLAVFLVRRFRRHAGRK